MDQEKITVVVPTYNNAPWLKRSLDSLMAQTYPYIEVIVVNDGSTDGTVAVLERYQAEYPSLRIIHKENGGVTSARLRGVAEATGSWIGFMDADDEIDPEMYARLFQNAMAHSAEISHCAHQIHFPDGRIEYVNNTGEILVQDHKAGLESLLRNEIEGSLCLKLYRRELFEGLAQWMDLTIRNNEDFLMNYYLFAGAKKSVFEGVCLYNYVLRKGSASYGGITEYKIFDPIRARQNLLKDCSPDLQDEVRQSMIRSMLFSYAQLTVNKQWRQYGDFRSRVRNMLKKERAYFHVLSLRNRVLSNMICVAPWAFHAAYRIYVMLFQREEQH